jgi:hypothetical protein
MWISGVYQMTAVLQIWLSGNYHSKNYSRHKQVVNKGVGKLPHTWVSPLHRTESKKDRYTFGVVD